MKRKRIASISMAQKKILESLKARNPCSWKNCFFFKAQEIWKEPGDFRLDFQVLLAVPW